MRMILLVIALAGCGGAPCQNFGCAVRLGHLFLKVHDSSGAPVANPSFGTATASCSTPDAGLCPEWEFELPEGSSTITVSAAGFQSQSVTAVIMAPSTCCGT